MPSRRPLNPLNCERLEDRTTPALFGTPWPNADHITVSFAPDGTDVSGVGSRLGATLDGLGQDAWRGVFTKAFQTWGQYANLNFAFVGDDGAALGAPGPAQGSSKRGDIRISARPLSDNVLAVTNPFDLHSSWAGDIVVNSDKPFNLGGGNGKYDLFTVAVQEVGHALGLDNSPEPASVQFTTYSSVKTRLTAGDISHIQALYGPRAPDRFDQGGDHEDDHGDEATAQLTFVTNAATLIAKPAESDQPALALGDLSTAADFDSYSIKTPKNAGALSVAFSTEGLSLAKTALAVIGPDGRLAQIRGANGQTVTRVTVEPGQAMTVQVQNVKSDATYKVVVWGADQNATSVGSYRLAAGDAAAVTAAVKPAAEAGLLNRDYGTNDSITTAWSLGDVKPTSDARWNFFGRQSIETPTDADYMKVHTKKDTQDTAVVLVSALDSALLPTIDVVDKNGVAQAVETLSDGGGTLAVQLRNVKPDTDYYLKVGSRNGTTGNYLVATDFRATPVALTPLASATLQGERTQAFTSFDLVRSQAIFFQLSGQAGVNAAVRMTVYDANNAAIVTVAVKGGNTAGASALLAPGHYTVRYAAAGANGQALPSYQFRSAFTLSTDPIGTRPISPSAPTPSAPRVFTSTPINPIYVEIANEIDPVSSPVSDMDPAVVVWSSAPPSNYFFEMTFSDVFSNPWW